MLVNWKVYQVNSEKKNIRIPNQLIKSKKYWFFRHINDNNLFIDVIDYRAPFLIHFIEKTLKVYFFQALKAFIKQKEYDVIISHSVNSGIVYAFLRKFSRIKRPLHIIIDIGSINGGRDRPLLNKFLNWILSSTDWFIYHATITGEFYKKCFPDIIKRSKYVPLGVDIDEFDPNDFQKNNNTEKYILSFGTGKRDWKTLIQALYNIPIKLVIIGNCKLKQLPKNIIVKNFMPINKLKEYIFNAEFIIAPITEEPYSVGQLTVLQSMALGKAVITTDVPGIRDYIINGYNGLLVEPRNPLRIRSEILNLLNDPDLIKKYGENARKTIIEKFNEKQMADQIIKIINKLIVQKK